MKPDASEPMSETLEGRKPTEGPSYLECPCCGDEGAVPRVDGFYYDGDTLTCGCNGLVSVDEYGAHINIGDDPCPSEAKCHD